MRWSKSGSYILLTVKTATEKGQRKIEQQEKWATENGQRNIGLRKNWATGNLGNEKRAFEKLNN